LPQDCQSSAEPDLAARDEGGKVEEGDLRHVHQDGLQHGSGKLLNADGGSRMGSNG